MRRRRRNRGKWFPLDPTFLSGNPIGNTWLDGDVSFTNVPGGVEPGDSVQIAFPLTLDVTPNVNTQQADFTLADFVQGQEYILERVVGKVWVGLSQLQNSGEDEGQQIQNVIACTALAVLPVQDDDPTAISIEAQDWNPLFVQNAQQPWLWRRTWKLSNQNFFPNNLTVYPQSSAGYGSVAEGGHLDTRGTKRRVSKEQRLFIIFAAQIIDTIGGASELPPGGINYGYDLRLVGGMRSAKNRSSFK